MLTGANIDQTRVPVDVVTDVTARANLQSMLETVGAARAGTILARTLIQDAVFVFQVVTQVTRRALVDIVNYARR